MPRLEVITNTEASYREEDLEGRPHLVVNIGMLQEAVVKGSGGALFYPRKENKRSVKRWNHQPIVVYHPRKKGTNKLLSARKPRVLNARKIGVVLNTRHDDKLWAEGWFDKERTKEIDPRIYEAILAKQKMEVSTGLDAVVTKKAGVFNGEKYVGVVSDYEPDHLAVLPDKKGAYPVEKGGGTFANEEKAERLHNAKWPVRRLDDLPLGDFGDPDNRKLPVEDQKDLNHAIKMMVNCEDPSSVRMQLVRIAARKGLKVPEDWTEGTQTLVNEMSYRDVSTALTKLLSSTYGERGRYWNGWILDVFPDRVIYCTGEDTFSQDYKVEKDDVSLAGDPVSVERTTEYKPVTNEEEDEMAKTFDKKAYVAGLIGNGYEESDRKALEGLPDEVLQKIKPEKAVEKVVNRKPSKSDRLLLKRAKKKAALANEGITTKKDLERRKEQEWMKNAPTRIRNQFTRMAKEERVRKRKLAKQILTNEANTFTKDYLLEQDEAVLEGMVNLMNSDKEIDEEDDPRFLKPRYDGAQGRLPVNNQGDDDLEDPPIPEDF